MGITEVAKEYFQDNQTMAFHEYFQKFVDVRITAAQVNHVDCLGRRCVTSIRTPPSISRGAATQGNEVGYGEVTTGYGNLNWFIQGSIIPTECQGGATWH